MSELKDQRSLEEVWERLERSARAIEEAMEALGEARGLGGAQAHAEGRRGATGRPDELSSTPAGTAELECLRFALGKERYAIEQSYVRRVLSHSITPLPGAGETLAGIVLVEETLTPVFDLGPLLGLPPTERGEAKILVLGLHAMEIGLLAESPHEVVSLDAKRFARVPWRLDPSVVTLVRGVCPDGTIVLEGAAILNDERFFVDPSPSPWSEATDRQTAQQGAW